MHNYGTIHAELYCTPKAGRKYDEECDGVMVLPFGINIPY